MSTLEVMLLDILLVLVWIGCVFGPVIILALLSDEKKCPRCEENGWPCSKHKIYVDL